MWFRHIEHFGQQAPFQRRRIQAEGQELRVLHVELVGGRLVARVPVEAHLGTGDLGNELGQLTDGVGLGHLIEDLDPIAPLGWIGEGDLDTADGVADVDERPGLAPGAVNGEWVPHRRLHEEPVEHGAVVAVVVEPVDQLGGERGLGGGRAPDDPLVEIGDPQVIVLVVEVEHQGVERLGHVIDAAGVGRVEELDLFGVGARANRRIEVSLGNGETGRAVAVHAHGAEMHDVGVELEIGDCDQEVVGDRGVVVDGVPLVPVGLHRVRSSPLLGEVHDGVGAFAGQELTEPVVVGRQIDVAETDLPAGLALPGREAIGHGGDGSERVDLELDVGLPSGQVVDDAHVVTERGEVERRRPPTEPVSAENHDLLLHGSPSDTRATEPRRPRPNLP